MKRSVHFYGVFLLAAISLAAPVGMRAQEADSGFSLASTVSGLALYSQQLSDYPRDGSPADAAFRAVVYPTWKIDSHWTFTGAVQAFSVPYFSAYYTSSGHPIDVNLLQANLSYSQFWSGKSLVVRVGQMPSAFGSFPLRYDDFSNFLVDVPLSYGYSVEGITTGGLPGAEVDATVGKVDMRVQFTNSSPLNPRSIFAPDQYGDWTWGGGYTIFQGLRVGVSATRGPYISRGGEYDDYLGDASPSQLPATAVGVDVEWARGPLNFYAEWQRVQMNEYEMPAFAQQVGYVEARWVIGPRWYAATRLGFSGPGGDDEPASQSYEVALGFRPGSHELVKVEYELQQGVVTPYPYNNTYTNTLAIQFVASLHPFSIATGRK